LETATNYAIDRRNLRQARSSFLTDSIAVKDSNVAAAFIIFGGALAIIFALLLVQTTPILFKIAMSGAGAMLVYLGISGIRLVRTLEKLQKTDIADAPDGLNLIQGTWTAEKNALTSPITKTKCVFYEVDLQEWVSEGKTSEWVTVATFSRGTPALLADATGYLAFDLENSSTALSGGNKRYYALDSEGELALSKSPQGEDLIRYAASNPYEFDPSTVGVQVGDPTKREWEIFKGSELSFIELTIPTTGGFAVGRVIGTGKTFNGKPVKAMVYDKKSRLLVFRGETAAAFEHRTSKNDYFLLIIGVALVIFGLMAA